MMGHKALPSSGHGTHVASFSRMHGTWSVLMSTCLKLTIFLTSEHSTMWVYATIMLSAYRRYCNKVISDSKLYHYGISIHCFIGSCQFLRILTWLVTQEDVIAFSHHEGFKSCMQHLLLMPHLMELTDMYHYMLTLSYRILLKCFS